MGGRPHRRRGPLTLARRAATLLAVSALGGAALGGPALPAAADGGAAGLVEQDFESAIKTLTPATVFCKAPSDLGALGRMAGSGSSGVLVTRDGYLLSDSDAGVYERPKRDSGGKQLMEPDGKTPQTENVWSDDVEIRIPDLKRGTYQVFAAKVVRRVRDIDSSLLKIEKPPMSGLPFVVPSTSAGLEVGHFAFAMGTAFPQSGGDASSSLTAGVVAALTPLPEGDPGGRWADLYTSAAVNDGVNGGPLVDADGGLVGIVSTWGKPVPDDPYQFLGKACPIDRIRAAYKDLPSFASIFPDPKTIPPRSKQADRLERAFAATAKKVAPSVVSLDVVRGKPVTTSVPRGGGDPVQLPRYAGPTSGIVVSKDGWIVASLYAFADVFPLAYFRKANLPNVVADDVAGVTSVTARFADGTSAPAAVVSHDQRLGVVCLKATLPAGYDAAPLEPAGADAVRVGRLVVSVARPFGKEPQPWPLLTIGVVSRLHPADGRIAWPGEFQTDAGMTDGTVGGALVDVRGRLLGVATLWNAPEHGRNSGIGFGVPWSRIEAALPSLRTGASVVFNEAMLGVTFSPDFSTARIDVVMPGRPAERAGVKRGDRIVAVDGQPTDEMGDAAFYLRQKKPGDHAKLTVSRAGATLDLDVTVAVREKQKPASLKEPTTTPPEKPADPAPGEPVPPK